MPVRAALTKLVAAGVLEARQQRSVIVPAMSLQRFDELLQVRLALEGLAAELAVPRLSNSDLAQLQHLHREMEQALHDHDAQRYLQANSAFHWDLYRACDNQLLLQHIEVLWQQIGPIFNALFDSRDLNLRLNSHHHDALLALQRRDARTVRNEVENDLRYCAGLLRHLFNHQPHSARTRAGK
jgi:DNA-binding GntR family transcriptional regulator